jgi:hypothetical protein
LKESFPSHSFLLRTNLKRRVVTLFFGLAWLAAVAYGGRALFRYETQPGRVGNAPRIWPADSTLTRTVDQPTLVIFAHPRCPCTTATIEELNQIMARVNGRVRAYVVFYQPRGAGADWKNTSLQRKAADIPGIEVESDVDGVEAARFGAETSGHTLLYDGNGKLLFSGGITASRGHVGDNAGARAILSLVNERVARQTSTLTFGCSLRNSAPIERTGP